ncbi:protein arginine kinase [Priestia taiwanensis]|uniref:Protein-arginine kinase n=1 Tax=Priestia taiwanensis TaxID=1347902 RepID=A0A917AX73_9BACI|nr:protein arginine kinase [Priestia taiwanensis]MBM7365147.1 protein arginine kinase [Priestia taiwanensis]GGE83908.1 protein-arginine kinase [Priestia taiwanensis]
MSLHRVMNQVISPWMIEDGPDSDIVMSTRIRLARNIKHYRFPHLMDEEEALTVVDELNEKLDGKAFEQKVPLLTLRMEELQPIHRRVLMEKHVISPYLAQHATYGACMLSDDERISMMVNEEDHIRIQCLFPGLQLEDSLEMANKVDDWIEQEIDYAFDTQLGYLTSCLTNVGTGLRASVMMHLPGLVLTKQLNRIVPAINQLGFVVRGIYGEGSEALGNIFQVSNQMTLGKSEEETISDLKNVVKQIISQERIAREAMKKVSPISLEDRVYRSLGTLMNSRIIDSKEAAKCLSDIRLGMDLSFITNISTHVFNELMILTQPGILQQYAGAPLDTKERDIRRASLIRERLLLEIHKEDEDK